jgi:hypothetical protein
MLVWLPTQILHACKGSRTPAVLPAIGTTSTLTVPSRLHPFLSEKITGLIPPVNLDKDGHEQCAIIAES